MSLSSRFDEYLNRKASSQIERHMVIVYTFVIIPIEAGLLSHLTGLIGSSDKFLYIMSAFTALLIPSLYILFYTGRISIKTAFGISCIAFQTTLAIKILYLTFYTPEYYTRLMVINIIVSVLNTVVAAMSYMKFTAVVCAVIDTVAFVIFSKVHSDPLTFSFIGTLVLMHVSILAMGFLLSSNAYKLQNENVLMKQDEETLLKKLNISKGGINAYFEVASTSDPTFEQVDKLFSSMDEKAQRNLTNAVRIHKVRQASKENILSSTFPQLSKSELEVCELILMGKKLTDICSILGKNESNINSVRVHIRQKIGIPHGVNLSEYLEAEIIHKNKVIPSDS